MATYAENLATLRNQLAERLIELTAQNMPTVTENGKTWAWTEYQRMMFEKIADLDKAIQRASGPFIVSHRGR